MGQSLQYHVGGGAGGIHHFMEHLMPALEGLMKGLQMPNVTPALKQAVIDGVLKEARGQSVEQLANEENDVILGALALRAKVGSTLP
jgi:hypothetical protein